MKKERSKREEQKREREKDEANERMLKIWTGSFAFLPSLHLPFSLSHFYSE